MTTDYDLGSSDQGSSWADRMEKDEVSISGDLKTVIRHEMTEKGLRKITQVYKIQRIPRAVATRKEWKKFGDAHSDGDGVNPSTTQVVEEVFLALTTNKETLEQQVDDPFKKLGASQKMVSCRFCKGDHWSSKCPYKDTLGATTNKLEEILSQNPPPETVPASNGNQIGPQGGSGKYVPPGQRAGEIRKGEMMAQSRTHDDQAAVRVTNLSEDANENDLRELFGPFGPIQRVFLAKDKRTQQSKGFAFVHFINRKDAKKAIDVLNGFGYDHLILKVEWAKPSNPK